MDCGMQVWLFLNRFNDGYARKLAHMGLGQFWVVELCGNYTVRLEIAGMLYRYVRSHTFTSQNEW